MIACYERSSMAATSRAVPSIVPVKSSGVFPCAYALRGETRDVPLAILSRSLVIEMRRATPRTLFDRHDPSFAIARELITKWWATVSLDPDPEMPAALRDRNNPRLEPRLADNCRPLIAVADTFGCGEEARAALIELCAGLPHRMQASSCCWTFAA